jgi:hypothetical protein
MIGLGLLTRAIETEDEVSLGVLNLSGKRGEAMAAYSFDDQNIKWNKLGNLEHLIYSIFNIDEQNKIIDVLFKFDANKQIVLHRHMVHNNTFVVQGEHRLYEPDGKLKEVRAAGIIHQARQVTPIEKVAAVIRMLSSFSIFVERMGSYTNCLTTT